ncbi:hypothetical protein C6A85_08520, partial [Mycobacterium sp. ITM-2017-0098]
MCHNCETALLSGSVRYDPEPLEPPAEGNILICCAQPAEAVVIGEEERPPRRGDVDPIPGLQPRMDVSACQAEFFTLDADP